MHRSLRSQVVLEAMRTLTIFVVTLLISTRELAAQTASHQPYPPSQSIERIEYDWSTHRRLAPGSDNWPTTWAANGEIFTCWGDGGGFGGSNSKGRVKLGVARVEGGSTDYRGFNVWGGVEPEHPAQFEGKSYGILSVDGTLFMWVAPQPNPHLAESRVAVSKDDGRTWQRADWAFGFDEGVSIPTFLNFGQDYAGSRDNYVYSYLIEPTWGPGLPSESRFGFEVHQPGRIHLSRVVKDAVMQRSGYEFFAGIDTEGEPIWTSKIDKKQPVFEDKNGVGWNVSVSFNSGMDRYLLATEHDETHLGKFGLFDAPEPWGPWTTVAYDSQWGEEHVEVSTFYWNFPNKWNRNGGRDWTMVFTGKNSNDSWNTVDGRFVMRDPEAK